MAKIDVEIQHMVSPHVSHDSLELNRAGLEISLRYTSGSMLAYSLRLFIEKLTVSSLFVLVAGPSAAAAPLGSVVTVRLLTSISTYRSKPGTPFEAEVTTPLCEDGGRALPEGAIVRGVLRRVRKVGMGLIHESARLQLEFESLTLADGREYPIDARLVAIENARERVDQHGAIRGIRATATLSNHLSERLEFAALGHPAALIPLLILESAAFPFADPEIEYGRGTEFELDLTPSPAAGISGCAVAEPGFVPPQRERIQRLVNELPYWGYSTRGVPLDLVNLLFIGSPDEIRSTFAAAGWAGAQPNSARAGMTAIRAIADDAGYTDAPMRTLLLDGAAPDLRLQKSLNTFEKRDHLRIWKRNGKLDGNAIWASAATRDTAVDFSIRPFGFTHRIEGEIDRERDKVVNDLVFTGCVDSVGYFARPANVRAAGGEYRKGLMTDGRIAVLTLNACTGPRTFVPEPPDVDPPGLQVRILRRIILTARNHFVRDHAIWRAGDALRMGYLVVRSWERQRREERLASQREETLNIQLQATPASQ